MIRYLEFLVKVLLAGTCAATSGCGAFRLPAIDPSGERIFLPDPSYTTVVSPYDSTSAFGCLPEPAFTEPPPIPPCTAGMPLGTGIAPHLAQDHLTLTPAKIVAPINSDVVLLAGLCGKEGFYVTKQPIEWMISPDSVGNIITLADSAYPNIARLAHHSPKKEASNLAITRTATAAHVITRGTAQPNDDIWVGKGQTWIAVSSPTEGTSYITAVAKAADNWDMRRQTAMIHWVDMQWAFPPPQIVRAGQPTTISTAVAKSSSGAPSVNTIVRYDIVQGTAASFNGDGRTSIELPTDENGRAGVQVVQSTSGPDTTQLRVQIHATNLRGAANDRTVIGEGHTTITWSAPGLTVAISGPPTVARHGTATYRIQVGNPGDITTRAVVIKLDVPADLDYVSSQSPAEMFGRTLQWQLGDLGPKQAIQLELNCRANKSGEVRLVARGGSPDVAEASSVVDTKIVESSLTVRFVDPPATTVVGQRTGFNFVVENTGGVPLQNVLIRDTFDAGLQPDYPNVDPARPMEFPPFALAAGESKQLGIAFIARQPGQHCHQLEVTADGGHAASDRVCVEASQPVLKLEVRKTGIDQARVGDEVPFTIIVANTGEGVLTNVKISDFPDANLRPVQGTDGFALQNGAVVWSLGTIGPGQTARVDIRCKCENVAQAAQNTVEVTADGDVRETTTATVAIAPAPQVIAPTNPPVVPNNPPPAITGEFKAQIISANFGIKQGEVGQFYLTLRNERNVDEEDVYLNVQLPVGLDLKELNWTSKLNQSSHVNPRNFDIGPIQLIRANETGLTPIKLGLLGTTPGDYQVRVEIRSRNIQQPVIATTRVTVAP